MFKVFSFVIIFISSFVFAHPDISKKALNQARQDLARKVSESKRLKDRLNIFCEHFSKEDSLRLEDSFQEACAKSHIAGIIEIREERDALLQQIDEIQNNSPEYQEFQLFVKEYDKLDYAESYYSVVRDRNLLPTKHPHPPIVETNAKKVLEAQNNWENTPQYITMLEKSAKALRKTYELRNKCIYGGGKDMKEVIALNKYRGGHEECMEAEGNYSNHLPQVYDARKKFQEMEKLFQEHEQQHKQERRRSTSGGR